MCDLKNLKHGNGYLILNDVSKREKINVFLSIVTFSRKEALCLIPRITNTIFLFHSLSLALLFFLSHRLDPISNHHHHAIRPLTRKAHLIFQVCIYTKHLEIKYLHIVLNKRKND